MVRIPLVWFILVHDQDRVRFCKIVVIRLKSSFQLGENGDISTVFSCSTQFM